MGDWERYGITKTSPRLVGSISLSLSPLDIKSDWLMCVADPKRIFGHSSQTGVITGDVPISGVPESVLSSVQWNVSDINENKTRMIFTFIKNLNWRFVIPHTSVIIETFPNQSFDQKICLFQTLTYDRPLVVKDWFFELSMLLQKEHLEILTHLDWLARC